MPANPALAAFRASQARWAALPPRAVAPCSVARPAAAAFARDAAAIREADAAEAAADAARRRAVAIALSAAARAEARRPRRLV